jgi:hypothetical protein
MSGQNCQNVRDLLPSLAGGSLAPDDAESVRDHLTGCSGCSEELEVVRTMLMSRPPVPAGLEARILDRIRDEFGRGAQQAGEEREGAAETKVRPFRKRRVPVWGLSAAAVLILALGTSRIWNNGNPDAALDPTVLVAQEPVPEAWLWDDGMIAGAPVFDGLSDEDLEALLEEYEG